MKSRLFAEYRTLSSELIWWNNLPVINLLYTKQSSDALRKVEEKLNAWVADFNKIKGEDPKTSSEALSTMQSMVGAGDLMIDQMKMTKALIKPWNKWDVLAPGFGRILSIAWVYTRPVKRAIAHGAQIAGEAVGGVVKRPLGQLLWVVKNIVPIAIVGGLAYLLVPTIIGRAWTAPRAK
jgi:hypothetical protein